MELPVSLPQDDVLAQPVRPRLGLLGFAPQAEDRGPDAVRFVLGNCPYRDAVVENPAVVCTLHRGMAAGLIDRLDPVARLEAFVAKDPFAAGCLIDVS